ncbi:MAG: hypothetical protein WA192_06265, partial [Candidatus Acidiferrales bacterium]
GQYPSVPPGGKLVVGTTLTAIEGFSGTVTFSCATSSPTITCVPVPASVTITPPGPTQVAFLVDTYCTAAAPPPGSAPAPFGRGPALLLFALALGGLTLTFRRNRRFALSFAAVMLITLGGVSCGSLAKGPNGVTAPGNYSLTISATTNGQTTTTPPINFTVQ